MRKNFFLKILLIVFALIIFQGFTSFAFAAKNYSYTTYSPDTANTTYTAYVPPAEQINRPPIQQTPSMTQIPKNEHFEAILQSSVSSNNIKEGDIVSAVVRDDWYYNGSLVAPAGSVVYGKVVKSQASGGFWRNGSFSLQFNEMVTPDGIIYITTDKIKIKQGKMRWLKVFVKFLSGAAVGALAAGDSYAAAPAALIMGAMNASEGGSETVLPSGSVLNLRLKKRAYADI